MRVTEVFLTLQGEGARAGEPSVFVRLSGCSVKHACALAGVECDTEFESGEPFDLPGLTARVSQVGGSCRWIVWTGGEPTDQLTPEMVAHFRAAGYQQQIETSGVRPVPAGLDWVTVSPKVAEHILVRHFPQRPDGFNVDEIKYVRHVGQAIPQPALRARFYCLSPHSDGDHLNRANLAYCIGLCLAQPAWRLSIQQHKVWVVR